MKGHKYYGGGEAGRGKEREEGGSCRGENKAKEW